MFVNRIFELLFMFVAYVECLQSLPSFQAIEKLYKALDRCEEILSKQRYICGNTLTEADIRLFVTLIRFDEV